MPSAANRSRARLVAITFSLVAICKSAARSDPASWICSRLSSTSRTVRSRRADEEHAVRELLDEVRRRLKREPSLVLAPRTRQRQQADVVPHEQRRQLVELPFAPDQGRGLYRQVRRPALQRLQRGEVGGKSVDRQLIEPLRRQKVLQPVAAKVAQHESVVEVGTRGLRRQELRVRIARLLQEPAGSTPRCR